MYALRRRGRRREDFRPLSRTDEAASERRAAAPNSAYRNADAPSDPALAEKMQSRMSGSFPGADLLSRGSGRPLELPDELRENLETHFGASLENVRFRESGDADAIGAKAYARGDEIHFAPGQFRPDTEQGRKMIGHEVSHIARQASGGMGNGVLLDNAQEHKADLDGEAIASGETAPRESASPLSPMPTASFDAAPAQGWGLGEHKLLTKLARKKAAQYAADNAENDDAEECENADETEEDPESVSALNKTAYRRITEANGGEGEFGSDKAKRSLEYGATFNDTGHHNLLGFGLNYANHRSAFVNQTHHGDMQFLHSMDTSGGDTVENMAKARRYARFASDAYQNKDNMQSQNMLDYVLSDKGETDAEDADQEKADAPRTAGRKGQKPPTRFQKMMLSTMLSAKTMKGIDAKLDGMEFDDEQARQDKRMALIQKAVGKGQDAKAQAEEDYGKKSWLGKLFAGGKDRYVRKKSGLSKYALGSVGDFFTGGDKKLDAGLVALGSASHMIEDSYAGSHASRAENLYLDENGKRMNEATDLSETGSAIAGKSTDVITAADYNAQDSTIPFVDLIPGIEKGRHNRGDEFQKPKNPKADPSDKDAAANEMVDNTRGGALARDAAAQFMLMNAREKHGGAGGANDFLKGILKADKFAAGLKGGVTRTGAAYAKKVRANNDDDNQAVEAFRKSTEDRASNKHASASQRDSEYGGEMVYLEKLRRANNPRAQEHYKQQSNETLVHMHRMIQQLEKGEQGLSKEDKAALENLREKRKELAKQLGANIPED